MADWLTFEHARELGLGIIALYAAAVSTLTLRLSARKEKRAVTVRMQTVAPAHADGSIGPAVLRVEATNSGHRPVTITALSVPVPGGIPIVSLRRRSLPSFQDTELPVTLQDGQSARAHFPYHDLGLALLQAGHAANATLRGVAEDSAGNCYEAEEWQIQPRQWVVARPPLAAE